MNKILINKKDLIRINQEIGATGSFANESSLDYSLGMSRHKKSWLYGLSQLVRSLLVDRAFSDGNKRTALTLIIGCLEEKQVDYDGERIVLIISKIAKKSINNVTAIMRLIEGVIVSRTG